MGDHRGRHQADVPGQRGDPGGDEDGVQPAADLVGAVVGSGTARGLQAEGVLDGDEVEQAALGLGDQVGPVAGGEQFAGAGAGLAPGGGVPAGAVQGDGEVQRGRGRGGGSRGDRRRGGGERGSWGHGCAPSWKFVRPSPGRCRASDQQERGAAAQGEADRLVEPDRGGVVGGGVQEGCVAAFPDARGDRADEPGGQAPASVVRVGADRADLGPARRAQPFAGHGDQPAPGPGCRGRCRVRRYGAERGPVGCGRSGPGSRARRRARAVPLRARVRHVSAVSTSWTPWPLPTISQPSGTVWTALTGVTAPGADQRGQVGPGGRVGRGRRGRRTARCPADSGRRADAFGEVGVRAGRARPRRRCPGRGRSSAAGGAARSSAVDGCGSGVRTVLRLRGGRSDWATEAEPLPHSTGMLCK